MKFYIYSNEPPSQALKPSQAKPRVDQKRKSFPSSSSSSSSMFPRSVPGTQHPPPPRSYVDRCTFADTDAAVPPNPSNQTHVVVKERAPVCCHYGDDAFSPPPPSPPLRQGHPQTYPASPSPPQTQPRDDPPGSACCAAPSVCYDESPPEPVFEQVGGEGKGKGNQGLGSRSRVEAGRLGMKVISK